MTFTEKFKICLSFIKRGKTAAVSMAIGIFYIIFSIIYFIPLFTDVDSSFSGPVFLLLGIYMIWQPYITCFYTKLLAASPLRKFGETTFFASMTFLTLITETVVTMIISVIGTAIYPSAVKAAASAMFSGIFLVGMLMALAYMLVKISMIGMILYFIIGIFALCPMEIFLPNFLESFFPTGYELITAFALSLLLSAMFSVITYFVCLKFYKKTAAAYLLKRDTI